MGGGGGGEGEERDIEAGRNFLCGPFPLLHTLEVILSCLQMSVFWTKTTTHYITFSWGGGGGGGGGGDFFWGGEIPAPPV